MNPKLDEKEKALVTILQNIQSCIIALSGGLDSLLLTVMASKHVPGRVLCVTISDPSTPKSDLESARNAALKHGLEHMVIISDIHPEVRANNTDRCYRCKLQLFAKLEHVRAREGLTAILDGENTSDSHDDRPGSRAARKCGIMSPLAEAGLDKEDIRELAKKHGITEWARPPSACLSSRIPFGTPIDDDVLGKIDRTEEYIRSKGIRMIRARVEGKGLRLELGQEENTEGNRAMVESLAPEIAKLGWERVKIDPGGYVPAGLRNRKHEN